MFFRRGGVLICQWTNVRFICFRSLHPLANFSYVKNTSNESNVFHMKKYLLTLLISFSVQLIFAQESKSGGFSNFDFTLQSGYQRMEMNDLNAFYGDSFFVSSKNYEPLHHAFYKALQLNYRLSSMLSIGTQLKVDQASSVDRFTVLNRSISITGQLDGIALLKKLFRKPIKNDWDLQLQAGLSYNIMQIKRYSTTLFWCYFPEPWYYANRVGGNAQVKLSYPIFKGSNAQWRLGLSVGYQYAQSKEVSEFEQYVSGKIQKTVSLGFSGINSGLSLTCEIKKRQSNKLAGPSKNAIYVDLLGQTYFGAIVYERSLNVASNGFQHSVSGGFISLRQAPWTSFNYSMLSLPFSYNASFDFNKTKNLPNKLELGIGLTAAFLKGFGASTPYRNQTIHPCLRFGYTYHSYHNGLLFKATIIPQLPGVSNTFNDASRKTSYNSPLRPSFCISIGKTF